MEVLEYFQRLRRLTTKTLTEKAQNYKMYMYTVTVIIQMSINQNINYLNS